MSERPAAPVLYGMKKLADEIADMAEREADGFRAIPGDVALRMFAEAIRKTNRAKFSDG